jgi:hypothetical protein
MPEVPEGLLTSRPSGESERSERTNEVEALPGPLGASLACPLSADHPAFLLGESAPDARVLIGIEGELETLGANLALTAHLPRLFELEQGEAGGADREEQFWVRVAAQCLVPPRVVGRSQGEACCE